MKVKGALTMIDVADRRFGRMERRWNRAMLGG